jgi:hypothetical protein
MNELVKAKKIAAKELKGIANCSDLKDIDFNFSGYSFRSWEVPEHYGYNKSSIFIPEKIFQLYENFFKFLENDQYLEYMEGDSLQKNFVNSELKNFILDLLLDRKFRNTQILKKRIDDFLDSIYKQLEDYKVIISINYFDTENTHYFNVKDSSIGKFDLDKFLIDPLTPLFCFENLKFLNDFKSSYYITVYEKGNNINLVIKRARKKANDYLDFLRMYYYETPYKTFAPKYFAIGEITLVFDLNDKLIRSGVIHCDKKPYFDTLNDECVNAVYNSLNNQNNINKITDAKLRNRIERTIHWLGRAITEFDLDICLILYCTALESLLIPEIEGKKGEVLALRVSLLENEMHKSIMNPSLMYKIYEFRSMVVHGSGHEISKVEFINDMETFISRTLYPFINYACKDPDMTLSKLIKDLETFENILEVFLLTSLHSSEIDHSIKFRNFIINSKLLGDEYIKITKKGIVRQKEKDTQKLKKIPENILNKFFQAAKSDNVYVRRSAVFTLGFLKEYSVVNFLNDILLQDEDIEVKKRAAISLGILKNQKYTTEELQAIEPRSIEILIQSLSHENENLRENSANALGFFTGLDVTEALIKSLKDNEPKVRAISARSLGFIRDEISFIPLLEALEDDDFNVIISVSIALGKFKDPRAVEPLNVVRSKKMFFTQEAIDWALCEINK